MNFQQLGIQQFPVLEIVSGSLSVTITEVPILQKSVYLPFEPFILWAAVNFCTVRKAHYYVLNLTPHDFCLGSS